jgi:hypothetical protein
MLEFSVRIHTRLIRTPGAASTGECNEMPHEASHMLEVGSVVERLSVAWILDA